MSHSIYINGVFNDAMIIIKVESFGSPDELRQKISSIVNTTIEKVALFYQFRIVVPNLDNCKVSVTRWNFHSDEGSQLITDSTLQERLKDFRLSDLAHHFFFIATV